MTVTYGSRNSSVSVLLPPILSVGSLIPYGAKLTKTRQWQKKKIRQDIVIYSKIISSLWQKIVTKNLTSQLTISYYVVEESFLSPQLVKGCIGYQDINIIACQIVLCHVSPYTIAPLSPFLVMSTRFTYCGKKDDEKLILAKSFFTICRGIGIHILLLTE